MYTLKSKHIGLIYPVLGVLPRPRCVLMSTLMKSATGTVHSSAPGQDMY